MSEKGHSRRFCPFGDMSVIRRIADENQISSDVADVPLRDIRLTDSLWRPIQ
jgi:hypothetical protein